MASIMHQFFFFSSILYLSFFINPVFSQQNQDDILSNQVDGLLELKDNLRNTKALDSTWKKGTNPCKAKWVGIICDQHKGVILEIRLEGLGLSGDFSAESLKSLQSLRLINIANNLFTGHFPDFWVLGKSLKILSVSNNTFGDVIKPDDFVNMTRLRRIDLSRNSFVGKIPETLTTLQNLKNLNMSHNGFSGPVPVFHQGHLKWLDLSNNKLEGEVPEEMLRFNKTVFSGNPRLCSPKQGMECKNDEISPGPGNSNKSHESKEGESVIMRWIVLSIIIGCILLTLLFSKKENDSPKRNSQVIRFTKADDEVHINMTEGVVMMNKNGTKLTGSISGKNSANKSSPELIMVNGERGQFGMPDLLKATAEVLGNGGAGSTFKAKMPNGVYVVVKMVNQMNKLGKGDFDNGMRLLGGLRHKNILPPLAYHYRKDEKLIVSEYVPRGSLLYLLHGDLGKQHRELSWPIRLKIIKGVAQGLGFLHSQFPTNDLPHGNLKSCNVLLSQDFEPLLNDYAFSPMVNGTIIAQTMFAYKTPEAIFNGKVSPKSDVYCLGIVILEVLTGKYPSQYLNNQSGGTDVVQWSRSAISEGREMGLIDPEIVSGMESSFGEMEKLLHIGVACTQGDHDSRIGIQEAIKRIEEIQD